MNHFLAFRNQKVWQRFAISKTLALLILLLAFTGTAVSCSETPDPPTPMPENSQPDVGEATVPSSELEEGTQEIIDESNPGNDGEEIEEQENNQNSDPELPENSNPFADLNQDWIPNLGSLRPIPNVQVTVGNAQLIVGQMGAWQDEAEGKLAYGFTLTNTSADHYFTNVQYIVSYSDGVVAGERKIQNARDFYPLETINLGETFYVEPEHEFESVEISLISAEAVPISNTPLALEWESSEFSSKTGIWVLQEWVQEDQILKDTNEVQFSFKVTNPNAIFVATNSAFSINILDDAGNILGQAQGDMGDIQPLRSWELNGSIFVESPDRIAETEIVIEPELFTPVDPTTLPTRLLPQGHVSFSNQNANITFSGQIDFEFHLTEMLTDFGFDSIVAIAYDADGKAIGGGAHELISSHLFSAAHSIFMPIRASATPATVELYLSYDFVDDDPGRGGGGGHPGRDI